MNEYIAELVELSKLDKKNDSFNPEIEAIEKKIAKEQGKVDAIKKQIDDIKNHIEDNNSKAKSYEEQITTLNEQLKSIAQKNKAVTNEKEMKALSMEEELAKEKLTFANEEIERLDKININKSEQLVELEATLVETSKSVKDINKEAGKELKVIREQKEGIYKERVKMVDKVDKKILAFYEKVRRWAGNTAVAPVRKKACYGCYMKINDKTYSELIRGDEIITCPHCGRILYLDRENTEA